MSTLQFLHSDNPEPHIGITRQLIKKHPELRSFIGKRNPWTALITLAVVSLQTGIAIAVSDVALWIVIPLAWIVGTIVNHTFFSIIHECSHNLIFKKGWMNKWTGIMANLPMIVPASTQFQRYHLKHHQFQGEYDRDADIPNHWEINWVRYITWRKIVWMLMYPLWQILRPRRIKNTKFVDKWLVLNFISCAIYAAAMILFFGMTSFAYLFASFWLCLGLSVPGGRLVQEHYVLHPPQETYSYYGWLSLPCLHLGYHNEHHDFPYASWNNLPKIRKIASEHYDSIVSCRTWSLLMVKFLFDPKVSIHMRMTRERVKRKTESTKVIDRAEDESARFPSNNMPTANVIQEMIG